MTLLKPENTEPKLSFRKAKELDDYLLRVIGIPFFGIAIPNFTGLFGHLGPFHWMYWIGYLYFIMIAFVIWQGNRWLLFKQREFNDWFNNPIQKLILLVAANVFYTAPITVLLIWGWYQISGIIENWQIIRIVSLVNVICVIFVTHVYETVFLIKERQGDQLQFARLEKAKAEAELDALKSQIDPHFMFNSLNTLSYLIENNQEKALLFNDKLADVYRYILMNKDKELVPLQAEIEFLNNYFTLLKLRFGNSIYLNYPTTKSLNNYLIPPISLQVLLENAVKHNEFDEKQPLQIAMNVDEKHLSFINTKRRKELSRPSSKVGLKNLNERYRIILQEELFIESTTKQFLVRLPLLETIT